MQSHTAVVEEHEGVARADAAAIDRVVVAACVGAAGVAFIECDGTTDG